MPVFGISNDTAVLEKLVQQLTSIRNFHGKNDFTESFSLLVKADATALKPTLSYDTLLKSVHGFYDKELAKELSHITSLADLELFFSGRNQEFYDKIDSNIKHKSYCFLTVPVFQNEQAILPKHSFLAVGGDCVDSCMTEVDFVDQFQMILTAMNLLNIKIAGFCSDSDKKQLRLIRTHFPHVRIIQDGIHIFKSAFFGLCKSSKFRSLGSNEINLKTIYQRSITPISRLDSMNPKQILIFTRDMIVQSSVPDSLSTLAIYGIMFLDLWTLKKLKKQAVKYLIILLLSFSEKYMEKVHGSGQIFEKVLPAETVKNWTMSLESLVDMLDEYPNADVPNCTNDFCEIFFGLANSKNAFKTSLTESTVLKASRVFEIMPEDDSQTSIGSRYRNMYNLGGRYRIF